MTVFDNKITFSPYVHPTYEGRDKEVFGTYSHITYRKLKFGKSDILFTVKVRLPEKILLDLKYHVVKPIKLQKPASEEDSKLAKQVEVLKKILLNLKAITTIFFNKKFNQLEFEAELKTHPALILMKTINKSIYKPIATGIILNKVGKFPQQISDFNSRLQKICDSGKLKPKPSLTLAETNNRDDLIDLIGRIEEIAGQLENPNKSKRPPKDLINPVETFDERFITVPTIRNDMKWIQALDLAKEWQGVEDPKIDEVLPPEEMILIYHEKEPQKIFDRFPMPVKSFSEQEHIFLEFKKIFEEMVAYLREDIEDLMIPTNPVWNKYTINDQRNMKRTGTWKGGPINDTCMMRTGIWNEGDSKTAASAAVKEKDDKEKSEKPKDARHLNNAGKKAVVSVFQVMHDFANMGMTQDDVIRIAAQAPKGTFKEEAMMKLAATVANASDSEEDTVKVDDGAEFDQAMLLRRILEEASPNSSRPTSAAQTAAVGTSDSPTGLLDESPKSDDKKHSLKKSSWKKAAIRKQSSQKKLQQPTANNPVDTITAVQAGKKVEHLKSKFERMGSTDFMSQISANKPTDVATATSAAATSAAASAATAVPSKGIPAKKDSDSDSDDDLNDLAERLARIKAASRPMTRQFSVFKKSTAGSAAAKQPNQK